MSRLGRPGETDLPGLIYGYLMVFYGSFMVMSWLLHGFDSILMIVQWLFDTMTVFEAG